MVELFATPIETFWNDLRDRHKLEPFESFEAYKEAVEERLNDALTYGELDKDEDSEAIKQELFAKWDTLNAPEDVGPGEE